MIAEPRSDPPGAAVDLYWLPLGAGARCVRWNGRMYETVLAAVQHRARCDLYHAALEVHVDGERYVIEMAPAWDHPGPDRGVVAEGPVGLAWLGRSPWFRYEVRRWRDGTIPDRSWAVGGRRRISTDVLLARRTLERVGDVPERTWGRDEAGVGEMWNSNSIVAWLLATSGHATASIAPPPGGRAPGWSAGLAVALAQLTPARSTAPEAHTAER